MSGNYGSIPNDADTSETINVSELPDKFVPEYSSSERESSTVVATFSLLNTILGAGVLSLPYAFKELGWLTALGVVVGSFFFTVLSLRLLCKLCVKTGSKNYSDIIRKTLGANAPELTDLLMFLLLYVVLIAFMCLLNDIAGDVAEYIYFQRAADKDADAPSASSPHRSHSHSHSERHAGVEGHPDEVGFDVRTRHYISSFIAIFFIFPLMTRDSLHSLRHISYLGMASILCLLSVLVHKCVSANAADPDLMSHAEIAPASTQVFLSALPIVLIAFLVQFNVIDVYVKLREPNESHINSVISWSVGVSSIIFTAFGLVGYFYAYGNTQDNILKNFGPRDPDLIIARIGLVVTLICQTPMIGLPCRNNCILVMSHLQRLWEGRRTRSKSIIILEEEPESESNRPRSDSWVRAAVGLREITIGETAVQRYGIPLCAVTSSLFISQVLPGVSVIWSVAGSSVSILLAFLLPSLGYIQFWRRKNNRDPTKFVGYTPIKVPLSRKPRSSFDVSMRDDGEVAVDSAPPARLWSGMDSEIVSAIVLFCLSCVLMVCCTYDSVKKVMYP
jgi:amino acid permease